MNSKYLKLFSCCLLVFCQYGLAWAGDPGGAIVVWVNLGDAPSEIDNKMKELILSNKSKCWAEDNKDFYMKRRPAEISNGLVFDALVKNIKSQKIRLNSLLGENVGRHPREFDGVVAYIEKPKPRLIGYTRGKKHAEFVDIDPSCDLKALDEAFCLIVPDVVRKP